MVLKPKVVEQEQEAPTLKELVQDPYIIIAAGMYLIFISVYHQKISYTM